MSCRSSRRGAVGGIGGEGLTATKYNRWELGVTLPRLSFAQNFQKLMRSMVLTNRGGGSLFVELPVAP